MKLLSLTALFFAAATSPNIFADSSVASPLARCETLEASAKQQTELRLPSSAILFRDANDIHSESGFYAESLQQVKGSVRTFLLDCQQSVSVEHVINRYRSLSKKAGYTQAFTCEQEHCGKKDGFRLFFSPRLNDDQNTQRYFLAKSGDNVRAIYAAEIDGQVRAYIVESNITSMASMPTNLIPFSMGNATLSESAKALIDTWVNRAYSSGKKISVSAYADASGSVDQNKTLTEQRAAAVKQYFIEKHQVAPEQIVAIATANLSRTLEGAQGRFVELKVHTEI